MADRGVVVVVPPPPAPHSSGIVALPRTRGPAGMMMSETLNDLIIEPILVRLDLAGAKTPRVEVRDARGSSTHSLLAMPVASHTRGYHTSHPHHTHAGISAQCGAR